MGAAVLNIPRDWGTDGLATTFSRGGLPGVPGSANGPRPCKQQQAGQAAAGHSSDYENTARFYAPLW